MKNDEIKSSLNHPIPPLSEAELADSAKAMRDDSDRFGLAFREMQQEAVSSMLEREGDSGDLLESIEAKRNSGTE